MNYCAQILLLLLLLISQGLASNGNDDSSVVNIMNRISNRRTISAPSEFGFPTISQSLQHQHQHQHHQVPLTFSDFPPRKEYYDNSIFLTKHIPPSISINFEKKLPYQSHSHPSLSPQIRIPIKKPYPIYLPKPYVVEIQSKQPYQSHITPIKIPITSSSFNYPINIQNRPFQLQMGKQFPIFIEKKILPQPIKISQIERPYSQINTGLPLTVPVRFPIEQPGILQSQVFNTNNIASSTNKQNTLLSESNKALSFLPGSTQEPYTLGTIHVPETVQSARLNATVIDNNDWVPTNQYNYYPRGHHQDHHDIPILSTSIPPTLPTPQRLVSVINFENIQSNLKEIPGLQYEPVNYRDQVIKTSRHDHHHQDILNIYPTPLSNINEVTTNQDQLQTNYQFFNLHYQQYPKIDKNNDEDDKTKWISQYNKQQEIPQYKYEISTISQTDDNKHKQDIDNGHQNPKVNALYQTEQQTIPILYGESIQLQVIPQTNSHSGGIIEQQGTTTTTTTMTSQQTLPIIPQQLEPTIPSIQQYQNNNTTENNNKFLMPIAVYSNITRPTRKVRRKIVNNAKRRHQSQSHHEYSPQYH